MMVRPALPGDAAAVGRVHVEAWRSAYAGLLPTEALVGMSAARHAGQVRHLIQQGVSVLVAEEGGMVVGFCTAGRPRTPGLADGEIETLYVLDDWREHGAGRALLRAAAAALAERGCRSLFLWVLERNPSRFFYQRLGGRAAQRGTAYVSGQPFAQMAYVWDPIGSLLTEAAPS